MLISLPILCLEISVIVVKKVYFLVCLKMLTLYLYIAIKAVIDRVSILPNLSKIYEKLLYQQLYHHFDSILSLE